METIFTMFCTDYSTVEINGETKEIYRYAFGKLANGKEFTEDAPKTIQLYRDNEKQIFCTPEFENMYFDDEDYMLEQIENKYNGYLM